MLYPSIDELTRKVESKYSLVVAAARRARALRDNENKSALKSPKSHKQVGIALEEIYHDFIEIDKANQSNQTNP